MLNEWVHILAEWVAIAMLNGVWVGMLFVGFLWCGVRMVSKFKKINASTRYIVWVTGLVLCIVLMAWQGIRSIPFEPVLHLDSLSAEIETPVNRPQLANVEPSELETEGNASNLLETKEIKPENESELALSISDNEDIGWLRSLLSASHSLSIGSPPAVFSLALFALWVFLAAVLLCRLLLSALLVYKLKKEVLTVPSTVKDVAGYWLNRTHCRRQVEIGASHALKSAVAVGYIHPMVLIPEKMLNALEGDEIEQVVVHELAHIQRCDDWTILFQQLTKAILFFHPGVLLLSRLMNRDREIACDDWVVSLTRKPKKYAACLAKLASIQVPGYAPLAVAPATSSKKQLFIRVRSILDKKLTDSYKVSRFVFGSMLVIAPVFLVGITYVAPLVAFAERGIEVKSEIWQVDPVEPVVATVSSEMTEYDVSLDDQASLVTSGEDELPPTVIAEHIEDNEPVLADIHPVSPAALQIPVEDKDELAPVLAQGSEIRDESDVSQSKQSSSTKRDSSLSRVSMVRWLDAVRRIPSPAEQKQLLVKASYQLPDSREVHVAYINVAGSIVSPSEKVESLVNLLIRSNLDEVAALRFLEAVHSLPTSRDRFVLYSSFLVQDEKKLIADERVRQAMKSGIESINTNMHYQAIIGTFLEVERELGKNN